MGNWMSFEKFHVSGGNIGGGFLFRAKYSNCCFDVAILDFGGDGGGQQFISASDSGRSVMSVEVIRGFDDVLGCTSLDECCKVVASARAGGLT